VNVEVKSMKPIKIIICRDLLYLENYSGPQNDETERRGAHCHDTQAQGNLDDYFECYSELTNIKADETYKGSQSSSKVL
jgi:hypothetical protein